MKKVLVILLISILVVFCGYCDVRETLESSASLVLKAYKNNAAKSGTALYVTDAITTDSSHYDENLGYLGDGRNLELTSSLSKLLSSANNKNEIPEVIVFSYRVESVSTDTGTYSINISSKGSFKNENDSFTTKNTVDFTWALTNVTFSTDGSASLSSSSSEGSSRASTTPLKDSWSVSNDSNSPSVWYRRGAVAILIDRNSYDSAQYGNYQTSVTVELSYQG